MSDRLEYRVVDKDGVPQPTVENNRIEDARRYALFFDPIFPDNAPYRVECRSVGEWREVEKEQT